MVLKVSTIVTTELKLLEEISMDISEMHSRERDYLQEIVDIILPQLGPNHKSKGLMVA
jgi:hypothetical protein